MSQTTFQSLPVGISVCDFFPSCFLQCFNATKLLTSHGMSSQALLNATEFNYLCPAIINQIDARSCLIHTASEKKAEIPPKTYSLQIGTVSSATQEQFLVDTLRLYFSLYLRLFFIIALDTTSQLFCDLNVLNINFKSCLPLLKRHGGAVLLALERCLRAQEH